MIVDQRPSTLFMLKCHEEENYYKRTALKQPTTLQSEQKLMHTRSP